MKKPVYDDTHCIAEQFQFLDTHICQMAKLSFQKVTALKLSYVHASYSVSHKEIYQLVKRSLLNYVTPDYVLAEENFFSDFIEN
ncbi:MAG: hypothetical protein C4308_07155 [Chitinophagaceae bacterium]